jgi:phosphatidylserine decarboxylase
VSTWTDHAFIAFQKLLPKRALSALVYSLARVRTRWIKNALIRWFMAYFKIELQEYEITDPTHFASFNEFFTRRLKPDARPWNTEPTVLACPVDGRVSAQGPLSPDALWQTEIPAKQHFYSVAELIGDAHRAAQYEHGSFVTIYLAPFNYHRVHIPYDGTLTHVRYCSGTLYSVNRTTAHHVPRLFVRNERVVCEFETAFGPLALVLVGALNVGCMSLEGLGEIRPALDGPVREFTPRPVHRGELLGAFNMGSTVIMVLPKHAQAVHHTSIDSVVRLGQALMTLDPSGR